MGRARVDVMSACFFLVMALVRFKGSKADKRLGLSKSLLICSILFACVAVFNVFVNIDANFLATTCFMIVQLISTCNALKDAHMPYALVVLSIVSVVLLLYAILDNDRGAFEAPVDVVDVV